MVSHQLTVASADALPMVYSDQEFLMLWETLVNQITKWAVFMHVSNLAKSRICSQIHAEAVTGAMRTFSSCCKTLSPKSKLS